MKNASRLLIVVIVLQSLTLLGQWTGSPRIAPASAQIPDPGAQRLQMVDEQKATNQKLDRLINLLESGKLQVIASMPDEKDDAATKRK
jgi:hypothetical protein